MPDPVYLIAAVAVSAAVTWGLRALPFAVLTPLRRSAALGYLAVQMPVGIMLILALYSLQQNRPAGGLAAAATAFSLAVAVGLHVKTRNAVLSILGGTVLHVALTTYLTV